MRITDSKTVWTGVDHWPTRDDPRDYHRWVAGLEEDRDVLYPLVEEWDNKELNGN